MAITSDTWWQIECDECGERFPEGDGGWPLFQSESEAREEVAYYDGLIEPDGKILCSGCVDEREAGQKETGRP